MLARQTSSAGIPSPASISHRVSSFNWARRTGSATRSAKPLALRKARSVTQARQRSSAGKGGATSSTTAPMSSICRKPARQISRIPGSIA